MSRTYGWFWTAVGLCCLVPGCEKSQTPKAGPALGQAGDGSGSTQQPPAEGDSSTLPDAGDPGAVFIAFAADFAAFHDWPHYDVSIDDDAGPDHPEEQLVEYINRLPPHGATAFPLRTVIVKEPVVLTDKNFFAMVKRGGNYNPDGATDWEWFELQNVEDGEVLIVWRGVGPPVDEGYGGDPNTGCNDCHTSENNDAVLAPSLDLHNF